MDYFALGKRIRKRRVEQGISSTVSLSSSFRRA